MLALRKGCSVEDTVDEEQTVIAEELPKERQVMEDVEPRHRWPEYSNDGITAEDSIDFFA